MANSDGMAASSWPCHLVTNWHWGLSSLEIRDSWQGCVMWKLSWLSDGMEDEDGRSVPSEVTLLNSRDHTSKWCDEWLVTPGMGNIIRRHVRRPADVRDDDHELVPGEGEEAAPSIYRVSHILGPHALAHSHSNLLLPSLRHRYLGAGHSQPKQSQMSKAELWRIVSIQNVCLLFTRLNALRNSLLW